MVFEPQDVEQLIKDLWSRNYEIRYDAKETLINIGSPAIPQLLVALKKNDRNESMIYWENSDLKDVFVQIGEPALQALVVALSPESDMGRAAVKTLKLFNEDRIVDPFIATVLNPNVSENVRYYALDALGQLKNERAFESLICLLSDDDVAIRGHAARALGEYQDERAIRPLFNSLACSDESQLMDWRVAIAQALTRIGEPARKFIFVAYHSDDWKTNTYAKEMARMMGMIP